MFKVYAIYGNNDKFFTETFFVKIGRVITWIKADLKINGRPYFSDEKITSFLEQSALATKFKKMKEGDSLDIQYGSCSNHYRVVKMTIQEVALLQEITQKTIELEKIKEKIEKTIPEEINQTVKTVIKELKKLKSQTA